LGDISAHYQQEKLEVAEVAMTAGYELEPGYPRQFVRHNSVYKQGAGTNLGQKEKTHQNSFDQSNDL